MITMVGVLVMKTRMQSVPKLSSLREIVEGKRMESMTISVGLNTSQAVGLVMWTRMKSFLKLCFLRKAVEGKRIKSTTILVVVPVRMPMMESQANKYSMLVKLFAMGMVTTLGENANESSVLEGMVMQEVKTAVEK